MTRQLRGKGKVLDDNLGLVAVVDYRLTVTRSQVGMAGGSGVMAWHEHAAKVPHDTCWLETEDGRVRRISVSESEMQFDVPADRMTVTVKFRPQNAEEWLQQEAQA